MRDAEAAGFRAAWCSDHFSPWSERQGESGFAWSWLGAAMQATSLPYRRRQRAGTALPPRDRGAGGRHAGRAVPRPAVGRARDRRVLERAHHRGPVAGQGDAQRPAARVRGRHPRAVRRRGRRPRRARARRPGEAVDAAGRAAAAAGHRGERGDGGLGGRVGRRADHHQPAARAPARDARRLRRAGVAPGAPVVGAVRGGGAADRARPVAHQRLRPAAVLGPGDGRAVRRGGQARAAGGRARRRARLRPTSGSTPSGSSEYAELGFDAIYLHHVGKEQRAFIEAFGEHVLPRL